MSTLLQSLKAIVGKQHLLSRETQTAHYRHGYRSGGGHALCVVFPQTLWQQWQVLQCCVEADAIIIMQAANTGLTEGSTPDNSGYDRELVIINTLAMDGIHLIRDGQQIVSLPGATLHALEQKLSPLDRAPHSVIGSSCLGASIVGGVCNNSGGALVKRGPAYTELALYARLNEKRQLELVNHLGIGGLGDTPEEVLNAVQAGRFDPAQIVDDHRLACDKEYEQRVRDIDAHSPSRFNADPRRLFEASGCAGKVAVFALRLDTWPVAGKEQVFYIGSNSAADLTRLRRDILSGFDHLPEVAEYMHRDIFNLTESYGKDTFLLIKLLGTKRLPKLFALKGLMTAKLNRWRFFSLRLPHDLPDKLLQWLSCLWPQHLPQRLLNFRDRFQHHLILKMSDEGIAEAEQYLQQHFGEHKPDAGFFRCTPKESSAALLHRFAAAGAPVRYQIMHPHTVADVLALDIALPRNTGEWEEHLPDDITQHLAGSYYYGHFMCHVFHQDYLLKKGADTKRVKQAMLEELTQRGAKYPAEHNVGHLYKAEKALQDFYRQLDPTNSFNPGVGKMSKRRCC